MRVRQFWSVSRKHDSAGAGSVLEGWFKKLGSIESQDSSPPTIYVTRAIKEVVIKKERTGEWYASFGVKEKEEPAKPANPDRCVGIDVGILKYAHDTDGRAVGSVDLEAERERLKREQRSLSRKQHGSNNWEKQRQRVAECHQQVKRKRHDFLHKLSNYYATEYDLVAVEDLNVK